MESDWLLKQVGHKLPLGFKGLRKKLKETKSDGVKHGHMSLIQYLVDRTKANRNQNNNKFILFYIQLIMSTAAGLGFFYEDITYDAFLEVLKCKNIIIFFSLGVPAASRQENYPTEPRFRHTKYIYIYIYYWQCRIKLWATCFSHSGSGSGPCRYISYSKAELFVACHCL
jgi:hypothetical protein